MWPQGTNTQSRCCSIHTTHSWDASNSAPTTLRDRAAGSERLAVTPSLLAVVVGVPVVLGLGAGGCTSEREAAGVLMDRKVGAVYAGGVAIVAVAAGGVCSAPGCEAERYPQHALQRSKSEHVRQRQRDAGAAEPSSWQPSHFHLMVGYTIRARACECRGTLMICVRSTTQRSQTS